MAVGTGSRLDTVDIADGCGWQVESTDDTDIFSKAAVSVEIRYSVNDGIVSAVKRGPNDEVNALAESALDKVDHVRSWLTGRQLAAAQTATYPEAYSTYESGAWTRQQFIAAVEDPSDRSFLLRFFELVDANGQLRSQGTHSRLHYGKRPSGYLFVYPFGRRFPPFKLSIKDGNLMISGCWKGNFKHSGSHGFAEIASMLGQDERGPARVVPVRGLDPDDVWAVGDRVSQAVN
ncbi:hypothetical protein C6A86_008795 [Mycobacterium sp. ITM-2016-00316]|uniref:hypothetical protein n=1 Tax=Mycobacterium sp. ITM-2016-00316 TaxID=2099695 RepID=UPI001E5BB586|nr:hypothetical protein [Mycobacterium sp. ITM-2016-00316]WNG83733.1 hypothetical protein C6A86_008795 [Mycobacterium sp. ITM-2016-00316]